jgi:predicted AAA+ superfamily ATPase
MKRIYEDIILQHFSQNKQMLFLAGPRQVGKTTISQSSAIQALTDNFIYLNWDNQDHRQLILAGPKAIAEEKGLNILSAHLPIIVFDELHKYRDWKNFLKGFFDTYKERVRIIVTGSSTLDIYRTASDSLMGRYFPYRVHPISVSECLLAPLQDSGEVLSPKQIEDRQFQELLEYGGFPEPFLKHNKPFSRRWQRLRYEQLFREDIRNFSQIHEIDRLEVLAELLKNQAGQLVNFSNLANKVRVANDTVRRWVSTLNAFYYCFTIKPWAKNVTRSLIKEPKVYLWDWSEVAESGARAENFIASHLLKAVQFWTDQGLDEYELYFLRDKEKREVDFLITKDAKPWFIVEVKVSASAKLSPNLKYFQQQTGAAHAFQVVLDMDYIEADCFACTEPVIVPAKTFLAQLV